MIELVTTDDNSDQSALRSADEALGYCAALALAAQRSGQRDGGLLELIKKTQKRIRRRTNPEMFTEDGRYK